MDTQQNNAIQILKVLERFEKMSQCEKAWIMTTLIDHMNESSTQFTNQYGTYVWGLVQQLVNGD